MLLPFIPQFALQMKNDRNMDRVDTIVNAVKEEARQEGYFTGSMIGRMKSDIMALGFKEDEINIDVTTSPKYRIESFDSRELINFDVSIVIEKKIAANRLFGISDEDNKGIYHVKGAVTSERLPSV